MKTKEEQIFILDNGFKIDLDAIIAIAPIEKNEYNNIIVPVWVKGITKPVVIICCNAIGFANEDQKERVKAIVNDLTIAWIKWKQQKSE